MFVNENYAKYASRRMLDQSPTRDMLALKVQGRSAVLELRGCRFYCSPNKDIFSVDAYFIAAHCVYKIFIVLLMELSKKRPQIDLIVIH